MTKQTVRAEDDPYYRLWMEAIDEPIQGPKIRSNKSINLSIAAKAAMSRPEVKAVHRRNVKAALARVDVKQRRKAADASPQVKANRSAAAIEVNASEEKRAKTAKTNARSDISAKRSASQKLAQSNPELCARRRLAISETAALVETKMKKCKPCTIDGNQIFEGSKALSLVFGQGKNGVNHPNFRYLNETEAAAYWKKRIAEESQRNA